MEIHEHDFDYKPETKKVICQCGEEQAKEDYTLETLQVLKDKSGSCFPIILFWFVVMIFLNSLNK